MNNFDNIGDRRDLRDQTRDAALEARLADPAAATAADAATAACNARMIAEQKDAIHGATKRRVAAMVAKFGDWAIVADVLASEGLAGEELASELAKCQTEAPDAATWMRRNV